MGLPRFLILGFGRSGRSAWEALRDQAEEIWIYEERDLTLPLGAQRWTEHSSLDLSTVEAILSPGISAHHPLVQRIRRAGGRVSSESEWGLQRLLPGPRCGITGTNGKTTTTELTAWMLNQTGIAAIPCGNNGVPLSSMALESGQQTLVIELSSYQLEEMSQPCLQHAAFLNLTPDHLDRHGSMEGYAKAKGRILELLLPEGRLLVDHSLMPQYPQWQGDERIEIMGVTLKWEGRRLISHGEEVAVAPESLLALPRHDWQNGLAAAWLATRNGLSWEQALQGWASYRKGPHRCEVVAERGGVRYVNDSKGTNLDATLQAMQSFPAGQILIAGGVHKGASYEMWRPCIQERVRYVLAIGQAAAQIAAELSDCCPVEVLQDLQHAVWRSWELAQRGETVLLSPGCSSLDQFRDYQHRGECFQQYVLQLPLTSDNVKAVGYTPIFDP